MKFSRYIEHLTNSYCCEFSAKAHPWAYICQFSGGSASKLTSFTKDADMPTTRFMLRLRLAFTKFSGDGAEGIRTPDPLLARQVLSQLSYNPLGLFYFFFSCFSDLIHLSFNWA